MFQLEDLLTVLSNIRFYIVENTDANAILDMQYYFNQITCGLLYYFFKLFYLGTKTKPNLLNENQCWTLFDLAILFGDLPTFSNNMYIKINLPK